MADMEMFSTATYRQMLDSQRAQTAAAEALVRYEWASMNWRVRHLTRKNHWVTLCGMPVVIRDKKARSGARICKRCDAYRLTSAPLPEED